MAWYVLNHISTMPAKRLQLAEASVSRFNAAEETALELFAPTIRQTRIKNGREEIIERPLTFHYVFVRGTEAEVKRLAARENGFSLILSHTGGAQRYAVVSDRDMEVFRRIAQAYGNRLPFFSLEDVDLQEGDLIEIIDGEFAGLQGHYLPRARSKKGTVVIAADNTFASAVFDVRTDHIRILKYAKDSRRVYDQIDAFVPRLLSAIETDRSGLPLTERQLTDLLTFTRRMETVRLDNHKIEAKLLALLIAAKRLLGHPSTDPTLDSGTATSNRTTSPSLSSGTATSDTDRSLSPDSATSNRSLSPTSTSLSSGTATSNRSTSTSLSSGTATSDTDRSLSSTSPSLSSGTATSNRSTSPSLKELETRFAQRLPSVTNPKTLQLLKQLGIENYRI